jgi:hypothetical protein
MSLAVSRLSSTGFESERSDVRTDPVAVELSRRLPPKVGSGLRLTELWGLGRSMLKVSGVVCGIFLAASPAAASQISCTKSGVDFDRSVFSGPYDFVYKKEEVGPGAAAGSGDEATVERAFAPADSLINGVLMSGQDGKYGNVFLITAHEGAKFGEPRLWGAIESKVRLFGDKAGSVAWGTSITSATTTSISSGSLCHSPEARAVPGNAWDSRGMSTAMRPATRSA